MWAIGQAPGLVNRDRAAVWAWCTGGLLRQGARCTSQGKHHDCQHNQGQRPDPKSVSIGFHVYTPYWDQILGLPVLINPVKAGLIFHVSPFPKLIAL
jgi:hypothetical protein